MLPETRSDDIIPNTFRMTDFYLPTEAKTALTPKGWNYYSTMNSMSPGTPKGWHYFPVHSDWWNLIITHNFEGIIKSGIPFREKAILQNHPVIFAYLHFRSGDRNNSFCYGRRCVTIFLMPGTFSQLYVQVVFAVGGRQNLIAKSWSQELYKYMAGIIAAKNQKSIIVNGMPDHIHIFIGLPRPCPRR